MLMKIPVAGFLLAILAITLTNPSVAEAQQVITDGLVSYWTFNKADIDGENVKDVFGTNNGVMVGKPQIVAGKFGEGLEFDGASYVEVQDDKSLQLWETYTLEAWIFQKQSKSSRIIDKITAGTADGPHLDTHPGTRLRSCAGNCFSTDKDYSLEEWHHALMTFDKGKVALYLDGNLGGEGQTTSPLQGNALSFKIAADSNGQNQFVGIIDEVRVYSRALDENEVKQNMMAKSLAVDREDKLTITWGDVKGCFR